MKIKNMRFRIDAGEYHPTEYFKNIRQAWRVDSIEFKFKRIPISGIECLNIGNYGD